MHRTRQNGSALVVVIIVILLLGAAWYFNIYGKILNLIPQKITSSCPMTIEIADYKNPTDSKDYHVAFLIKDDTSSHGVPSVSDVSGNLGLQNISLSSVTNLRSVSWDCRNVEGIYSYLENEDKSIGYMSLFSDDGNNTNAGRLAVNSYLYKIDLSSYTAQKIWEYDAINNPTFSEEFLGGVRIWDINSNYLTLSIDICTSCSPGPDEYPIDIILNTDTGSVLNLGEVGAGEEVNLGNKTVSYQKYVPVKKSCDQDPGGLFDCVDGFFTSLEPSKEISSAPLP